MIMNTARKAVLHSKWPQMVTVSKRSVNLYNKDLKPGPYPTTPEERAAAAAKYNLLPEEYEPCDELGDYPKLPDISGASKDPHYNYDMPALKKDFGEPMHVLENIISEERGDINFEEKQYVPLHKRIGYFIGACLLFYIPTKLFEGKVVGLPHLKKHYLRDGPHYKYP